MAKIDRIPARDITPPEAYFNRRKFLIAAGSLTATALTYRRIFRTGGTAVTTREIADYRAATVEDIARGFNLDEPKTSLAGITNYNNFYEFTTDKEAVSAVAAGFVSKPWQVALGGLVQKPQIFDLDDLDKISPSEERVYRMRCVEGWSMVIPWIGIPLHKLLAKVEPSPEAKYVAFETLRDPARMPGQRTDVLEWPYMEGLRLDEAMHPLVILATGLYGRELPPQNGAPLRLVVPWKYGFKGIKSIVKITLTADRPVTSWNRSAPREYGFYSNVNPEVPHPRWSQADEQRIGAGGRRPTLMFNGYADQVASLYSGMDLRANF